MLHLLMYCSGCLATPVRFRRNLTNQEAPEGGIVVLHCELSKPGVPVQWWKDDEELGDGSKYRMKQEGLVAELHIRNVLPVDVGRYSCVTGDQKTTAEVNVRGRSSETCLVSLMRRCSLIIIYLCHNRVNRISVTHRKNKGLVFKPFP